MCRNKKKTKKQTSVTDINYDYVQLIKSRRKTGFLGFIIALTNVFELYKALKQEYLLTYKLSQDNLESFFGAIRSFGGSTHTEKVDENLWGVLSKELNKMGPIRTLENWKKVITTNMKKYE